MTGNGVYSLRQRYIVMTGALSILIFAFAWMAQSYVNESGIRHLDNIEQRNQMAQTVRQLRNSVLQVEKDLDAFMWTPNRAKRNEVHQSINQAAEYFANLKQERWFTSLGYAGKLGDFGINVDSLHPKLDHIMDTRLNTSKRIPVISAIELTVASNSEEFRENGQALVNSLAGYAADTPGEKLHDLLARILERWPDLNRQLDSYIDERRNNPRSEGHLPYQEQVSLLYGAIDTQLNSIRERQQELLNPQELTSLEKMLNAMDKWYQGFQQIRGSSPEEYLRTDIPYLKHTIEPHFEHLWRYLSALEQNLERYSSDEASHQQIIIETITNGVWAISLIGLIMLAMGFVYFDKGILTPVARVARALRAEAKGDESVGLPQVNSEETQQLIEAFDEMRSQVQDRQQALEYQALHDSLTSLPNRYHWQNQLERHCRISQDKDEPIAVLMLGLDRFKDINDTLGHRIGDRILQLVGERLSYLLKEGDGIARLGSDEYAILLPGSGQEEAIYTARHLLKEVEQPFQIDQINLYVGVSIGIALYPEHATSPAELTRFADIAMHVAKQMKSGYSLYERKLDTNSILKLSIATDLRHAIKNNALQLYYQPQQFLHNNQYAGMEVLLRWKHPVHGQVSPESFIPIAEQTGMIHPITLWVIETTFEEMARWGKMGIDPGLVSINISVFNLQASDFVQTLDEMMKKWEIPADKLMLEITETAMMADPINAKNTLDKLNGLGLKLAIDDFGTGFSSLAYIKQLPVHELKIDKSFVIDMLHDENDAVIVHSTIDLAHNLGLKVVAEGVENQPILEQLRHLQCDVIQGHHYGKPLPRDEIERMMPRLDRGTKVRHIKDYR